MNLCYSSCPYGDSVCRVFQQGVDTCKVKVVDEQEMGNGLEIGIKFNYTTSAVLLVHPVVAACCLQLSLSQRKPSF